MATTLLELCEDSMVHFRDPRPGAQLVETDRFVLKVRPRAATLQRLRAGDDDLDATVEEVRDLARAGGSADVEWWVGELATPRDAAERLLAAGFVPLERAPTVVSMAATRPPDASPRLEVRAVDDADDYVLAQDIDLRVLGTDETKRRELAEKNRADWPVVRDAPQRSYLAYLDGEPVAFARALFGESGVALLGGGTLPHARGRGAYVSLVHARWQDAVARGTPSLVVQAGTMSRPILERLGFEPLGEIRLLVDRL